MMNYKPKKQTLREKKFEFDQNVVWKKKDVDELMKKQKVVVENVIKSANYFRKKALEHVKTTSREFVYITTDHVVGILKEELKVILN